MLRRRLLPLLCLPLLAAAAAWAEDEDPGPQPPARDEVLLARVESDPAGEATRLSREVAAALGDEDAEGATDRLLRLAHEHPDALVRLDLLGAARHGRTDGALHWPAHAAVNLALARLPAPQRARAVEAWAPKVAALMRRVARGDRAALRRLADHHGITREGGGALLLLARRARAAGRLTMAARDLERWLELHPDEPAVERAGVAVRLADTLLALDDAGGLQDLGLLHHALRDVEVATDEGSTTLAGRLAAARVARMLRRDAARRAARAQPSTSTPIEELEDPVFLWSRRLRDPHYLRQGLHGSAFAVQAGVWGPDEGTLVVHEGRVVRRLDAVTGLERWRFPRTRPATLHDLIERYNAHDLPWRAVTPAGDAVLVPLGEPPASGRYKFLGSEYEADELGQECRVRLACLDLETGALRWHTGAVDDEHPVLGHRTTGLCAPPLVVGEAIYALFAMRDGATTFHLARLDRTTGKPDWVATLVGGDSGRDEDGAQGARFTSPYAQSVPWGARPTLAGDEICALPHAGFAAGVGVQDGAVRWVRALPRFALDEVAVRASLGHSVQNVPLAWGDAWILAPMDSPRMLCIARGSGDLRWQRGGRVPGEVPAWRDLLGIVPDARGRPQLRLSGDALLRMDPRDGSLESGEDEPWAVTDVDPGGRVVDVGPYVLRAADGGIQARPWRPTGELEIDGAVLTPESTAAVPHAGDLVRVGSLWVVVGPERLAVYAQPKDVARLLATRADDAPAVRASRLMLAGRREASFAYAAQAVEAARRVPDPELQRATFVRIAAEMVSTVAALYGEEDEVEQLRRLGVVVRTLPPAHQGAVLRVLVRRLFRLEADEDAARLCVHWLRTADDTLVARGRAWDPLRDDRVRGDLLAASLLRTHAERSGVKRVLDEHERASAALLAEAREGSEARLRAAIRRGEGSRAAEQGRRLLLRRLKEAGRHAAAAAVLADLRLAPARAETTRLRDERIRRAARLQMEEAARLASAGDGERARTLAADLERWAPSDLLDREDRDAAALAAALRARFGWHPYDPERPARPFAFDTWPDGSAPADRDETRSIEFLALTGPGANRVAKEHVLLARGLTVEVWSLAGRRRTAALPGGDEGWFGGSLRSIDRWVPGGGILVTSLVAGEPADGSGVRDGDWIHTWAGEPVTDLPAFMRLVASSTPGKTIPVGIWRDGKRVLTRFTAGRRPVGQGRLVVHDPLWCDAQGRVLVPGRTGLSWVDPARGTRTPHWAWTGDGVVRRCLAVGGELYVTINRGLLGDLVVAVDPERGVERWRATVPGSVTWLAPVGSALWIQGLAPGHSLLVDRHDGRPRARLRSFDRFRHVFRRNWEPDPEAAVAAGRGYLTTGGESNPQLRIINTTTAHAEWEDDWPYQRGRNRFTARNYVNPMVAAGAYVCVARQGGLRFLFPDPLGVRAPLEVQATRRDLMGNESHHGAIDSDSRLYVRGHVLFLLRMPQQGRKNVNVHVFNVNYDDLRSRPPTSQGPVGNALWNREHRIWLTGPADPIRYTMNIDATFEGLLVSTAQLDGRHRAETWWIAAESDVVHKDNRQLKLLWRSMLDARRSNPKRIGDRLFVPVDRGARVFPVRRYDRE